MKALILQHVSHEGPGTLGRYLEETGAVTRRLHLHDGEDLPDDPRGEDLIVSMGGPMSVYDDDRHPFLPRETRFLSRAVDAGVPVIGICLGAQLIARACGARVYRAPVKEIGWGSVTVTDEGRRDTLLNDVPGEFSVLQWHEDTFDIPAGGTLLATSEECPHQAFRVGSAYGLQFHVEVDTAMLEEWFASSPEREGILEEYGARRVAFDETAGKIYGSLAALARVPR